MAAKQSTYEDNDTLRHVHWTNAFHLTRGYSGPPRLPGLDNTDFLDFAASCGMTTYVEHALGTYWLLDGCLGDTHA